MSAEMKQDFLFDTENEDDCEHYEITELRAIEEVEDEDRETNADIWSQSAEQESISEFTEKIYNQIAYSLLENRKDETKKSIESQIKLFIRNRATEEIKGGKSTQKSSIRRINGSIGSQ